MLCPGAKIKGTTYKPVMQVSSELLAALNNDYSERLKNDKELSILVLETEELRNNISRTRISLNEQARKLELEEAEKRRAEKNDLSGVIIEKEGVLKSDKIDVDDKYLREGLVILSDMITAFG